MFWLNAFGGFIAVKGVAVVDLVGDLLNFFKLFAYLTLTDDLQVNHIIEVFHSTHSVADAGFVFLFYLVGITTCPHLTSTVAVKNSELTVCVMRNYCFINMLILNILPNLFKLFQHFDLIKFVGRLFLLLVVLKSFYHISVFLLLFNLIRVVILSHVA